jgi:hypothetical protein
MHTIPAVVLILLHPTKSTVHLQFFFHFLGAVGITVVHTTLRCPHSNESGGVRSGDLGGHSPREMNRSPKSSRSNAMPFPRRGRWPQLVEPRISLVNPQQSDELHEDVLMTFFKQYRTDKSAPRNRTPHADFRRVQRSLIVSRRVIRTPQSAVLAVHIAV